MSSSVPPPSSDNNQLHWLRVDFVVPDAMQDVMCAECFDLGSCGLQCDAVDSAHTRVTAFFDQTQSVDGVRAGLRLAVERMASDRIEFLVSEEKVADWNAEWRRFYKPVWATEKIVVHPPWLPVEVESGQMSIVIDPAMAFGTGGHESTQTALAGLEDTKLEGRRMLDVGTGSGVLAIAASRLGVTSLVAVDIDAVAIENARLNLHVNLGEEHVSQRVILQQGSAKDAGDEPFDVIVANIESHILLPMVPDLLQRLGKGGCIIFSGLLRREERTFIDGLIESGLTIDGRWQRDDWFSCRAYVVD
ncbi:MAG: 50S ribosomal protein L11 methyltransferase [Gemmatimonadetes bacterium]|nr:50S ribosomal protein L11 methyltransferase [Gemmatimonadota bacterium]MBT5060475.1 50S ribosomal protein L11 methyltransferase [Gemmatimonadota bacterium]MBT5142554.1 50S ribosomal protein L11 methyltransferase [Gemmatimonadota bacterium]MBT5587187.1 50S ribosomal protein L11 methyltransferase [Gemmatimonadota bacterium]MBT5961149.1 50S ribosomal protein L11 methyltransferase [Gemmatimonadota bacterium]